MHYHIVWTTYGTWLPGDIRGWMRHGSPSVQPPDLARQAAAREQMREAAVRLDVTQQRIVADTIAAHCRHRGWVLSALAVKANHVHIVVEANRPGDDVRDQFKAWCSRRLSDHAGAAGAQTRGGGRRRWFTERGYAGPMESEKYLQQTISYVEGQAASQAEEPVPPEQ